MLPKLKIQFMQKVVFIIFILFNSVFCYSQDINDKMLSAFSASYSAEITKDYSKAIESLKSVYNENSYETNLRLGWLCYQKKDNTESERYYKQALKLKPGSVEAMFGLVSPCSAQDKWPEVLEIYQQILKIDPVNSVANYRIALMYYYKKEFARAESHLAIVVDHYPFDYDALVLMGQVKLAMGKLTESKAYYQRALLYSPSNDEIKKIISKL
jgi:tetratricopeptide (TPR) repeat protein